ncbi:uncharacterized protein CCOS01_13138 [Colletotrichum costaricense]|uniref:Uncharacterized protein n=1 Tax=Colletotrichum costaricense TaxID=1209916 RepID=A0AAJ0DVP2_9PEZI|nr:uncharacterized protein CCOS01_13138 [Colletotrichum costaricense]KAK1515940.1 hypothetical protein CCOS01_13138 [Colletotrichum costaricense]
MALEIDRECWKRWEPVIKRLAATHGFPAANLSQLTNLLRLFNGEGSTFRITGDRWRFIIDATRQDKYIVKIIAITVIARHNEDERRNGVVIARACNLHPSSEREELPGAPHLKWYPVTSGGEVYQHCCAKECTGPDRSTPTSRGTWETSRLRIVQKAYEQELLVLRELHREAAANASPAFQGQEQSTELSGANNEPQHAMRKHKSYAKIDSYDREKLLHLAEGLIDETGSLRHELRVVNAETETLRARNIQLDKENAMKSTTIGSMRADLKRRCVQMEKMTKEDTVKDATIENQRHRIKSLREKNKKLETEVNKRTELATLNEQLEAGRATLIERQEDLTGERDALIERKQSLADSNADLEAKMAKMERKKARMDSKFSRLNAKLQSQSEHIETLTTANDEVRETVEKMNESTAKLESEKAEAIKVSEGLEKQLTELYTMLHQSHTKVEQLQRDIELEVVHKGRTQAALNKAQQDLQHRSTAQSNRIQQLERDVSDKHAFTQSLQSEILCLQQRSQGAQHSPRHGYGAHREPLVSAHKLQYQREISRQANEKASDMESKLEAMKLAMEAMKSEVQTEKAELNAQKAETNAKKAEVEALAKKCAERMNAANAKESYTMSLEKQLEEMRGNMEGMLGRVSVYQGKKRRRTEGPDFQL